MVMFQLVVLLHASNINSDNVYVHVAQALGFLMNACLPQSSLLPPQDGWQGLFQDPALFVGAGRERGGGGGTTLFCNPAPHRHLPSLTRMQILSALAPALLSLILGAVFVIINYYLSGFPFFLVPLYFLPFFLPSLVFSYFDQHLSVWSIQSDTLPDISLVYSLKNIYFRAVLLILVSKTEWKVEISHDTQLPPLPSSPTRNGSRVTTVEPTMTHHNHPKSIVYIRIDA